jgi:hypothetical protein
MPELYILCQIGEQLGKSLSEMVEMTHAEVTIWAQYYKIKSRKQNSNRKG